MRSPLEEIASWADPDPPLAPKSSSRLRGAFSLERFIAEHLQVRRGPLSWDNRGQKWELEVCPFNTDHTDGCAVVTLGNDSAIGFKCQHNSCTDKHWQDLRELFEPGYRMTIREFREDAGVSPSAQPERRTIQRIEDLPRVEDIGSKTIEWDVEGLVPSCTVVLFTGEAGAGKSTFVCGLAHAVSTGKPFL